MKALLLVDIQPDFCPGGALPVPEGDAVVEVANRLGAIAPLVLATQDWHPEGHSSFAAQGGPWPEHCVQGTPGAELHPGLRLPLAEVVRKGASHGADSYSGFADDDGTPTALEALLRARGVEELVVMGLATDYCVKATVLHALERGFSVEVLEDGCRGVNIRADDSSRALEEMQGAGARVIHSDTIRWNR